MRFLVLFTIVVIALCGQAAAQCFSASFRCVGATTADSSFEDCCRQVVANNNLERSFLSGGGCSSCIVLGLDQSQYTLAENSTFYSLRLRLLSPANTLVLGRPRLRLRGVPGTASEDDFRVASSDILIQSAAGLDVAVTISNDGIAGEPRENFTITSQPPLVSGSRDAPFLFRDSVVNIIDSDEPTYQFDQSDYVTTEGPNAHIEVVVQQIVQSVRDVHLLLTPLTYAQYIARSNQSNSTLAPIDQFHGSRPSNAHHEDNRQDFNKTVRRVFFPANSGVGAEQRVGFPVFDDVVDEDSEGFIIVLDVDRELTNVAVAFTPNLRTTLGRISDDDPFFFGFEQEEFVYNERRDEGSHDLIYSPAPGNRTEKTFSFALNLNALQGAFTFGTNGDINLGSDIIRPTFMFVGPGSPVRIIAFSLNFDDILEGQEIGILTIAPSTAFDGFAPRFQSVRIIINDSNSATVNLSAPLIVPEQNRTFLATISLIAPSGGATIPLEIDINDTGITATPFSDYLRLAPPSVVFQGVERPGCCVRTVLYDITDDNIAEPDEILTLSIVRSLASNQIPVEYVVQSVNVTIVDNDAVIGFVDTDVVVSEAGGIANLTIQSTALTQEVTVRFSTVDNTAVAGTDYTAQVITLSFNQGVRQHTVSVPILQDIIKEEKEQFQANLELVNDNGLSVVIRPAVANVTIVDSNIAVVKFVQNSYTFNESDGTGLVYVEMVGQVDGTKVTVTIIDNEQAIHQVELPANVLNPRVSLTVNISDNNVALENDLLRVFRIINTSSPAIIGQPNITTVTIRDDDTVNVGYTRSSSRFSEADGSGTINVSISNPIANSFTIRAQGSPRSQSSVVISGTNVNQELTFTPTSPMSMIISMTINDDETGLEQNEIFPLTFSESDSRVTVGGRGLFSSTEITIEDDDAVNVGYTQSSYRFSEAGGSGTINVSISNPIATSFTVRAQGGSRPQPFVVISGTDVNQLLTFTPTSPMSMTISMTINDDETGLEQNEIFPLTFSESDSRVTVGGRGLFNSTDITIEDDDAVNVGYTRSSFRFSEADGSGTINVSISNPVATSITIRAQGGPGSRPQPLVVISGTDVNQQLTFTPTSPTTMSISMTINDDEIGLEQNEIFPLTFSESDSRVTVGGRGLFSSTDITIEDDDELDISMVRPAITVREDAGFAEVCFMLSRQSIVFIDVSIDGQSGSAIENNDFREVQSQVGVVPPSRRGCVNYTIIQDSMVEQDETFTVRLTSAANPGIRQPRFPEPRSTVVTIVDPTPTDSTCVVTPDGRIQAFQKDGEGTVYTFRRPCEHPLLTTCSRRVPSDFGIFIDTTSGTTSTAVIGVRINGTTVIVNEEYALPSLGVSVRFNRLNGSVTITISTDSPLQDECGLCGRRNGSLVLPNGNQIDASREADVEEFITSYRVMPGDTFLMPDRRQCGILTNDTVEGDPTFTVPLLTFRSEDHTLCYEIHGEANRFLNLVSDICVSVNAHYVERPNPRPGSRRPLNIIDQIAVRASDSMEKCVNIVVNLVNGECQAMVGTQPLSNNGTMFVENRLSVRSYRTMTRISVPNCENVRLVMRVYCELTNGVHMIRYHINRGYNLRPTSHGLVAQFWNIPATVERYTGTLRDGSRRDDAYIITLRPPNSPIRRVPAFLSSLQWNLSPKSCLYAGNAQGGPIYEIVSPNDPLIEGRYQDYFSSSSFDTNFQYERFDETSCTA